ncbi:MAG: hypothetical protein WD773_03625 [Gemmatimonadales bacterium]
MRVTLDSQWMDKLRRLPESGMGYQRVRVKLRDGRVLDDAVVLNAQVLQLADDVGAVVAQDIVDLELEPVKR